MTWRDFGANGIGQVNHVAITDTDLEGLSLPIVMKRVSLEGNIHAGYTATISLPSGTPLQNYTLTVTATDRKDLIGTGSATFTVTDERVGIRACDDKGPGNGRVYRDGELVDLLKGNEMFIEVGKNIHLIAYYKIMIPGEYQIKGTVLYEGKETEANEVSFTVPEQE